MEAQELRQLKKDELEAKVGQWREELFRTKFKSQTSEAKDTSVFPKLKRDIARALTILQEAKLGIVKVKVASDMPAKAKKTATKTKTAKTKTASGKAKKD